MKPASLQDHRPDAPVIVFFGYDAREPTIIKRIAAFMAEGCEVVGFTFQRERPGGDSANAHAWTNVNLGFTVDRNYLLRVPRLILAVLRIMAQRDLLRRANVLYARNIDQALIACAVRGLARLHAPLVYEVLDVHRMFTRRGLLGRTFRFAERRVIARSALLVISSPRFLTSYFQPVQNYAGPWYLLENKVAPSFGPPLVLRPSGPPPWVIGWSGVLRCRRSLSMLVEIATRLGQRVRIILRGRLSLRDISAADLAAALARCPNLVFDGPYTNPADLAAIYGAVHFTWAVDYTDAGFNSDWLVPNRVYEGGLHGAVMLARGGTATGDLVEKLGLGWLFREPLADGVVALLEQLDHDAYEAVRRRVEATPRSCFVDEKDSAGLLARMGLAARSIRAETLPCPTSA
jgi:succinoglycan biosynthesis protein ExoL